MTRCGLEYTPVNPVQESLLLQNPDESEMMCVPISLSQLVQMVDSVQAPSIVEIPSEHDGFDINLSTEFIEEMSPGGNICSRSQTCK